MKTLTPDAGDGNGTPPKAAEVAANGKSEREILLERRNKAQAKAITVLKDRSKSAEETAAAQQREAEKLKQLQTEQIAKAGEQTKKEESSWGFYV